MKKNMGTIDKVIRITIALVLIVLFLTGVINGILGIVLTVLAVVFILTSLLGFCPLYTIFGIHTLRCKVGNDD